MGHKLPVETVAFIHSGTIQKSRKVSLPNENQGQHYYSQMNQVEKGYKPFRERGLWKVPSMSITAESVFSRVPPQKTTFF